MGEAVSRLNRQISERGWAEDDISMDAYDNDADMNKRGLSKYVHDKMDSFDLDAGDYSVSVSTDADDDSKVSAVDVTIYGNEDLIATIYDSLKSIFNDVIVKAEEGLGNVTYYHCFNRKV